MSQLAESGQAHYRTVFPESGKICWIGLRPGQGQAVEPVSTVQATTRDGLIGDRFAGKPGALRQVTLIQQEHLQVVASILKRDSVDPAWTRRNIVVSGINLTSLKGCVFSVGDALFEGTGPCPPCGQMEFNLGPGGFNAMRGHGGITARVIRDGTFSVGDRVKFLNVVPRIAKEEDASKP